VDGVVGGLPSPFDGVVFCLWKEGLQYIPPYEGVVSSSCREESMMMNTW